MAEYWTDAEAAVALEMTEAQVRNLRKKVGVKVQSRFSAEEFVAKVAARPGRGSVGGRSRDARYGARMAREQRGATATTQD